MAMNMCRLLDDEKFAKQLSENGIQTILEMYNNYATMLEWRENYHKIVGCGK